MNTPWGESDFIEDVGDGILQVSTASHGGFFVPDELLSRIPEAHRQWASHWSGSQNWFEEDCCWAAVCLAFPERFTLEQRELAQKIIKRTEGELND